MSDVTWRCGWTQCELNVAGIDPQAELFWIYGSLFRVYGCFLFVCRETAAKQFLAKNSSGLPNLWLFRRSRKTSTKNCCSLKFQQLPNLMQNQRFQFSVSELISVTFKESLSVAIVTSSGNKCYFSGISKVYLCLVASLLCAFSDFSSGYKMQNLTLSCTEQSMTVYRSRLIFTNNGR